MYIAGPITGMPDGNREAFLEAQKALERKGYAAMNPRALPEGMPADWYMPICMAMVCQADALLMLPMWMQSSGATLENRLANYQGKTIYQGIEDVPDANG